MTTFPHCSPSMGIIPPIPALPSTQPHHIQETWLVFEPATSEPRGSTHPAELQDLTLGALLIDLLPFVFLHHPTETTKRSDSNLWPPTVAAAGGVAVTLTTAPLKDKTLSLLTWLLSYKVLTWTQRPRRKPNINTTTNPNASLVCCVIDVFLIQLCYLICRIFIHPVISHYI